MNFTTVVFIFLLLICAAYASIVGGRTGRAGAAIFIVATALTVVAFNADPTWEDTSYGVFAVDFACLIALVLLMIKSNRYWPIWATGFQTIAVATHLATMFAVDIVPAAYRALLTFWSIPILVVMVLGTLKDSRYDLAMRTTPSGKAAL